MSQKELMTQMLLAVETVIIPGSCGGSGNKEEHPPPPQISWRSPKQIKGNSFTTSRSINGWIKLLWRNVCPITSLLQRFCLFVFCIDTHRHPFRANHKTSRSDKQLKLFLTGCQQSQSNNRFLVFFTTFLEVPGAWWLGGSRGEDLRRLASVA